jgi:hypothetical protein
MYYPFEEFSRFLFEFFISISGICSKYNKIVLDESWKFLFASSQGRPAMRTGFRSQLPATGPTEPLKTIAGSTGKEILAGRKIC